MTAPANPFVLELAREAREYSAVLQAEGRYLDALELARRASRLVADRALDLDAATTRIRTLTCLGANLAVRGRPDEAELILRQALVLAEGASGDNDQEIVEVLRALGRALQHARRFCEAEAKFLRALSIVENGRCHCHPDTAAIYRDLTDLVVARGQHLDGQAYIRPTASTTMARSIRTTSAT